MATVLLLLLPVTCLILCGQEQVVVKQVQGVFYHCVKPEPVFGRYEANGICFWLLPYNRHR